MAVSDCSQRLPNASAQTAPPAPVSGSPPADEGFDEQAWLLKQQVDEALRQLPEPLREILILREMHELSYEETAQALRIPVGTVRSWLFTARQRFAQIWKERETE
ncbi:MAG: RNA polymerase sigma factor [Armatimonadota bacterium]